MGYFKAILCMPEYGTQWAISACVWETCSKEKNEAWMLYGHPRMDQSGRRSENGDKSERETWVCLITASPQLEARDEDMAMDRWCIHPALDGLRLLNTKISLVQTIGQYELPGMKTRGGQSIVRARGHTVTRMGRGVTRVDGADQWRRGGGGSTRTA